MRLTTILVAAVLLAPAASFARTTELPPVRNRVLEFTPLPLLVIEPEEAKSGMWVDGSFTVCRSLKSFQAIVDAGPNGGTVLENEPSCDSLQMTVFLEKKVKRFVLYDGRIFEIYKIFSTEKIFVAIPRKK
jgi:hypothetical protein